MRLSKVEVEDVDFERDSNQGSLVKKDEDKGTEKKDSQEEREKRYLLQELKAIKDSLYGRLVYFKARTQGKRHPSKAKMD